MKKIMMVLVLVFTFACGVAGKEIVNEVKRQNDQKFVKTAFYEDELIIGAEHKQMKGDQAVNYTLDAENGVYASGKVKDGKLEFLVYKMKDTYTGDKVSVITFERTHRKADDCYRVMVQRDDQEPVCVTYTGDLFKNVIKTELDNIV